MFTILFSENCAINEIIGKIWWTLTAHGRQYNMAHAHCILRNKGYRHTQRIRNTYCLSSASMVKLYVHYPSCYHIHVIFDSLHPLMELIRNNPETALVKGENDHVVQSNTVTSLRSVRAIDCYIDQY